MKLYELLDKALLGVMIDEGFVRYQVHPSEPLAILNYTEKTAYTGTWNDVTRKCRGLIYNMVDEDVVARPFDKFFNYEQVMGAEWLVGSEEVEITDKLDGSLGILYREPISRELSIATRGSFQSDQAIHATKVFRERYASTMDARVHGVTHLYEIVYPENRIVLDYGYMDDLVHIGGVHIDTGETFGPNASVYWPGLRAKTFSARTFAEALALPPRKNAEGIVVRFLSTGERVKIKQEDYIALHRIVTGMNDRKVWEFMVAGKSLQEIEEDLPEEFWAWVNDVYLELLKQFVALAHQVHMEYDRIISLVWKDWKTPMARKEFAAHAVDSKFRAEMFMLFDTRDITDVLWKRLKPEAGKTLVRQHEDAE
jgi:RNA ligase